VTSSSNTDRRSLRNIIGLVAWLSAVGALGALAVLPIPLHVPGHRVLAGAGALIAAGWLGFRVAREKSRRVETPAPATSV
jgi:hypothetical protein